jgi:beta-glucosidase/6-phospho-beta-glucosidase/beta-galactosidase
VKEVLAAGGFFWAAGIEDTFITHPWPATGRILDEYELTLHYERWREDLNLFAELGVPVVRYGVPWHRINPARGQWDWSFPDRALDRLLGLGIEPIVDLVHYGLPPWIEGAFLSPDFPARMAEYAGRAAQRYRGRIYCYTPLNEPRVTAWYSGKLGWWPPERRGWRGFVQVMAGVCAGIVSSVEALREVDRDILPVHVDATDLYESADQSLQLEAERRQEIVFLALDLVSGRVKPGHALYDWVLRNGMTVQQLERFEQHRIELPLIGINLYPLFSDKVLYRSGGGLRMRMRMRYAPAEIIDRLARMYWERYRAPLFISETASEGSIARREAWLKDSVQAVKRVRERGVPLVGYTWWPLFALVTWAYRQGVNPPEYYLKQMGLWDLRDTLHNKLERVPTPLVEAYSALISQSAPAIGECRAAA